MKSSFMDMLKTDGYTVGRGTYSASVVDPVTLTQGDPNTFLQDTTIQQDIQQEITGGKLQAPDADRLYVVFVEDNVPVQQENGNTSINNFAAYHFAFSGTDAHGNPAPIYYAVVTYPGGAVNNSGAPTYNLTTLQLMTQAASHEIAEAATDPANGLSTPGWQDHAVGGGLENEIGDVVDGQAVFLKGYAVQRISDKNDQAMTPVGATPVQPVTFVLENNGQLLALTSSGSTSIASGVASISDQSIDNFGSAVIDYVDTNGNAWGYEDCTPSRNDGLVFGGMSLRSCLLPKRGQPPREGRTYVPTRSLGSPFPQRCRGGAASGRTPQRPEPLRLCGRDSCRSPYRSTRRAA
jgi:hypothetical protein